MEHISLLPHIEEALAVLKQLWVPIHVQAVEPGQYTFIIDPENALVLGEIVVA